MSEKKQQPAYPLRMPAHLRDDLEALAKINKRSLNAEIVARLEFSIEDTDELGFSDRNLLSKDPEVQQFGRAARGIDKEKLTTILQSGTDEARLGGEQGLVELFAKAMVLANERLANEAAPKTAKRMKRTRPLGMDQAEWVAQRIAENVTPPSKRIPRTKPKTPDSNE